MKKILIALIAGLCSLPAVGQTCTPGGGITCTANLDLYVIPQHYPRYDIPINANTNLLDTFSTTVVNKTTTSAQTLLSPLIVPTLTITGLGSTTTPVCPNGTGGALTTIGCTSLSSGFPIVIGDTSIGTSSTTTTIDGLTLTAGIVNGVTLNSTGSSSLFLNQAGGYTAPPGTSGTVTSITPGAGLTSSPNPIVATGTISIATAGVTNAMLVNNSITINSVVCSLGGSCNTSTGSILGGALGSLPYQSLADTTVFIAGPTTNGHAFVPMWQPTGSLIAPTAVDLGTYLGANITQGGGPITVTPSILGVVIDCPTCTTGPVATTVTVNGGSALGAVDINATAPVADSGFFALTPAISGGSMIIESPFASSSTWGVLKCSTGLSCSGGVATTTSSLSGMTSGQVAIAGSATTVTSSIALGNTGSDIPQLSSGLLAAAVIPNNAANTTGFAAGIAGGALGSVHYQSAANTTVFVASPTTSGHQFFLGWTPSGSVIAPTAQDLGTYLGANVAAAGPITVTPTTLGISIDCPTCSSGGAGTNVGINGGASLGSLNINALAPLPDSGFFALTPKVSGASLIIEAPLGTSGGPGLVQCGTGTTCTAGVITTTASLSGMTTGQVAIAGSATTVTSSIALGNSGSNIPQLSGGLLNASIIPNNAANTTGTAASLAGGALGSVPYQSLLNTTSFITAPTTNGHAFVVMERPIGSPVAPTLADLGTYLGTNITGSTPVVVTATTLGVAITCPSCKGGGGTGTAVSINGGSALTTMNLNAISPVADANFLALTPKVSSANVIIEAPYGTSSTYGVFKVDGTTVFATGGVLSSTPGLSGMTSGQLAVAGSATTITSSIAIGNTGSSIPQLSSGLLNSAIIPNNAANTSGTAANLSGTPTLPNGTAAATQTAGDNTTKIATDAFVIANAGVISGLTTGQVAIAGGANSVTSSIALGNTGTNIPRLSGGLLASSVIPNNAANTTGNAAALAGGLLGSVAYQSAVNTTTFVSGPTTSGHAFFLGWQPSGSLIAPAAIDLGTFLGANVTASSPIVATPSTLGTNLSCPTCGTAGGGTSVSVNGGATLGTLNINATSPVADASFLALTPKISGGDTIIEAPFGTTSAFGVLKCGAGTTCTAGVISTASLAFTNIQSGTNVSAAMLVGSGASLGPTGTGTITATSMPYSGLTGTVPTWNQNTTGTAANLTAAAALPNGTSATTQTAGDNTTKLATDAFVLANSVQGICKGTISLPTAAIASGSYALATPATCAGLLSTDNILLTFNGSPLAINGYMPNSSGQLLTIYVWPTSAAINVAVGNSNGSPVTPGAATLNYRVLR